MKSRKTLTILLALALVCAMATAAFAAWPSFQNTNTNNGVTEVLVTTPATPVAYDDLPNNGAWTGVSSTSVIDDDCVAYTLYNGGIPSGADGGARLQATTLFDASEVWNIQLNGQADNLSQLSTPYLDTTNDILYALATYNVNLLSSTSPTAWLDAPTGNPLPSPYTFTVGTTTIYYDGTITIGAPLDSAEFATDYVTAAGVTISGTLTLTDTTSSATYTLTGSGWKDYNFNLYAYSTIPAGTYDVELEVTTDTAVDVSSFKFNESRWALYAVSNLSSNPPTATQKQTGFGQANTPISYDGSGNLYFAIYGGDRSYYQYNIAGDLLNTFTPGDNFYLAGATVVTVKEARDLGSVEALVDVDYAVFGSDSGTVYWREVADFENAGYDVDLTATEAGAGSVRSSIVAPGDGYIYFTSQGDTSSTGNPGYLWKFEEDRTYVGHEDLNGNSTSTPVISDNDYIYVGWYRYNPSIFTTEGGVQGFDTNLANPVDVYGTDLLPEDPVQASPVVCSDGTDDYVYFTTNSASGAGYGYYVDTTTPAASPEWPSPAGGSSANPYALQGFAACSYTVDEVTYEYLVYGDDGGRLYIIEQDTP